MVRLKFVNFVANYLVVTGANAVKCWDHGSVAGLAVGMFFAVSPYPSFSNWPLIRL